LTKLNVVLDLWCSTSC